MRHIPQLETIQRSRGSLSRCQSRIDLVLIVQQPSEPGVAAGDDIGVIRANRSDIGEELLPISDVSRYIDIHVALDQPVEPFAERSVCRRPAVGPRRNVACRI